MTRRLALILAAVLVAVPSLPADDTPRRASARKRPSRTLAVTPAELEGLYRPTLVLRKGNGRGSGTVIRSVTGETLILTAAHVVRGDGPLQAELRPYNLGVEKNKKASAGTWPRLVPAEVVAADPPADVALVRIRGMVSLPYVARLDLDAPDPRPGDILTSIGVDRATELIGWRTDIQGIAKLDLAALTGEGEPGDPRPFIITTKPSVSGRSGGGLFRRDGGLAGVCVGRVTTDRGETVGAFASCESIRRLFQQNQLELTRGRVPEAPPAQPRRTARPR
jgi:S1-C subfamily serine protease